MHLTKQISFIDHLGYDIQTELVETSNIDLEEFCVNQWLTLVYYPVDPDVEVFVETDINFAYNNNLLSKFISLYKKNHLPEYIQTENSGYYFIICLPIKYQTPSRARLLICKNTQYKPGLCVSKNL